MLETLLHNYLPILIHIIEIIGIFIVATGAFKAFIDYIKNFSKPDNSLNVRNSLGTAMVTGLEFKMAAEILRTVIVRTKEEIILLGSIIILREILFYFINKEMKEHKKNQSDAQEVKKITNIKIERE